MVSKSILAPTSNVSDRRGDIIEVCGVSRLATYNHDNVVTRVGHVVSFKRDFMRYAIIPHYLQDGGEGTDSGGDGLAGPGGPPEAHGNAQGAFTASLTL